MFSGTSALESSSTIAAGQCTSAVATKMATMETGAEILSGSTLAW
jgi:surface antigen